MNKHIVAAILLVTSLTTGASASFHDQGLCEPLDGVTYRFIIYSKGATDVAVPDHDVDLWAEGDDENLIPLSGTQDENGFEFAGSGMVLKTTKNGLKLTATRLGKTSNCQLFNS